MALAVVAISLVGLLGLHNGNLRAVGVDQDLARATLLARQLITEMELVEGFPDPGFSSGDFADYTGFRWERQVEDTDQPDIRRVDLRVVFDERIPDACRLVYYIRDRREPVL